MGLRRRSGNGEQRYPPARPVPSVPCFCTAMHRRCALCQHGLLVRCGRVQPSLTAHPVHTMLFSASHLHVLPLGMLPQAVRYSLRPPVSAGTSQMAPHIKQSNRSYAEQAQSLHGCDDLNILRNAYPKPDVTATEQEATAYRLPFSQVPMVPVEVGAAERSSPAVAPFLHHPCHAPTQGLQLALDRCCSPAMVVNLARAPQPTSRIALLYE